MSAPRTDWGAWARGLRDAGITLTPDGERIASLPQLRKECAWCGAELHAGVEPTSHGICEPCAARHFPEDAA